MVKILGGKRLNAQRGFIMPLMGYGFIAAGVVILALGIAVKIQSARLDSVQENLARVKGEYASFQIEVKRIGEAAEAKRKDVEAKDKQAKEKADESLKNSQSQLAAARNELRNTRTRAGGGLVPQAAAGAQRPDRAVFDRAELDRALSRFEEDLEGLIGEGAEAVIKLNAARKWNQERN